jgi:hypothetical protein
VGRIGLEPGASVPDEDAGASSEALRFYADSARHEVDVQAAEGIENVGLAALLGLRISLLTIRRLHRLQNWDADKYMSELDDAAIAFTRIFDGIRQSGREPGIIVGSKQMETSRLGKLPDGSRAIYIGPAELQANDFYPINYWGKHWVAPECRQRDLLPRSVGYEQWFIGHCSDDHLDFGGYAISFNHLLKSSKDGLRIGAAAPGLEQARPSVSSG